MDNDHVYTKFCKERFEALEAHQEQIAKNISAIREKVFDGYGSAIDGLREDVKSLRLWIMGLIATVGATVVVSMIKLIWMP